MAIACASFTTAKPNPQLLVESPFVQSAPLSAVVSREYHGVSSPYIAASPYVASPYAAAYSAPVVASPYAAYSAPLYF